MLDPPLPDRMDPDFERERPTLTMAHEIERARNQKVSCGWSDLYGRHEGRDSLPPMKLLRFKLTEDGVVWPLLGELPGAVPPC